MRLSSPRPVLLVVRLLLCLVALGIGVPLALSLGAPGWVGAFFGLGFALLLITVEALSDGFSFRHFTNGTVGLMVGFGCAWLLGRIGVFHISTLAKLDYAQEIETLLQLALFVGFGFLGAALALRAHREEFSLLIPYVRFRRESSGAQQVVTDRATLADGRLPAMVASGFLTGELVVPRFAVEEMQEQSQSDLAVVAEPARAGLAAMQQLNGLAQTRLRIVETPREVRDAAAPAQVVGLARALGLAVLTVDPAVERLALAQAVPVLSLTHLTAALRPELKPGDVVRLELVKAGKEAHQAVGYLADGTMVVVNQAATRIGERISAQLISLVPTAAGRMGFAEVAAEPA